MRNVILVFLAVSLSANGQCPAPGWFAANDVDGVDGTVLASVAWDPDGPGPASPVLAIGGSFTQYGTINHVAVWDGTRLTPLGSGLNTTVNALCVYNGELVAGGNSVARWNGTAWVPLGSGLGVVNKLIVYNGNLIALGAFLGGIASWNGSTWSTLGAGLPNSFFDTGALAVYNGDLIAGGTFTTAGGVPANHVARWNGAVWQPLGAGVDNEVDALTVYNGELVAGGFFLVAGVVGANRIARWNGSTWAPFGAGFDSGVTSLRVYNGNLIAGGLFFNTGATPVHGIARWNGASWLALAGGVVGNSAQVWTLEVLGSDLFVAGTFSAAGYANSQAQEYINTMNISRWDGANWHPLTGMTGPATCMTVWGDDLVVAGQFTRIGSLDAVRIGRWNGASWQTLEGFDDLQYSSPYSLCVYNGQLVAVGGFYTASLGGIPLNGIAWWSGSGWAPFGTGMTGGTPNTAVEYQGLLVASGYFSAAGGIPANRVAAWNGASWLPLGNALAGHTSPTSPSYAWPIAVYNGELVVGGDFTSAGGSPVNQIAHWNGSTWQPLGSGVSNGGNPSSVYALIVFGNELVAVGGFSSAGGVPAAGIARWNGSTWQGLGSGVPFPGGVSAMAVHGGELIVAGGNGIGSGYLARWNGATWQSFPTGVALGPGVLCLASYHGALMVGGSFQTAGGVPSPNLARWSSPLPQIALSQPDGGGTGVVVSNRWLTAGHVYYDVVSLDLSPGGVGTGPWGGLTFNDPSFLFQQLALPIGATPFHWIAAAPEMTFGPFTLPPGLTFECLSADVTSGTNPCLSSAVQRTVY